MPVRWGGVWLVVALLGCAAEEPGTVTITLSGSTVGAEGALLARQVARYEREHPGVRVRIQPAPDDATQRHQLYVQWLNARVGDPDLLQLDVIWIAEFAAAGWILPLDRFGPPLDEFFPAAVAAASWEGRPYALPWWIDTGMLYWRTDLLERAPRTMDELFEVAKDAAGRGGTRLGIVWQGARYEGLVTVFLEYLGAFGGRILDDDGRVALASAEAGRALEAMRRQLAEGLAPRELLTWHEEETRFAFQSGRAVLMRNWPYAYRLMADSAESAVVGRYAAAPMPGAPGGAPTAALGGSMLAINAWTDVPQAAYQLASWLAAPEQALERAEVAGHFPARHALFDDPRLAAALPIPAADARAIVERARPRPVTPVYSELSALLQIELHRALSGQTTSREALAAATRAIERLLDRSGLREPPGAAAR